MSRVPEWEPKRLTAFEKALIATGRAHIAFDMVMKRCDVEIRLLCTETQKAVAIRTVATQCMNKVGLYHKLGKSWDEAHDALCDLLRMPHATR